MLFASAFELISASNWRIDVWTYSLIGRNRFSEVSCVLLWAVPVFTSVRIMRIL